MSGVFVALFAVANPVIENWLQNAGSSIGRVFGDFFSRVRLDRVALWIGLALVTWTLLRGRVRWKSSRNGVPELPPRAKVSSAALPQFDMPALLVRCLILFNIVFAIQMAIDLTMMLSNGSMLPEGMTYPTYARRGAYPLVATALLAAAFVLITFPSGRDSETIAQNSTMRWARRLVLLWIAQNVVLTLSAGWRLEMYVGAFSLTRLRVAAAIWMALVAIGLITVIWRVACHRTNVWLVRANMVALLSVLYLCCFVNFDAMIAWYDVKHSREAGIADGPHVDRRYLRGLGPEAIAPFRWLAEHTDDKSLAAALLQDIDRLKTDLDSALATWQGWTLRRARIAASLKK
jgi:hypothetical protein